MIPTRTASVWHCFPATAVLLVSILAGCVKLPVYQCPTISQPVYFGPARFVGSNAPIQDSTAIGTFHGENFYTIGHIVGPLAYYYITWENVKRNPEEDFRNIFIADTQAYVRDLSIRITDMYHGPAGLVYNQQRLIIEGSGTIARSPR